MIVVIGILAIVASFSFSYSLTSQRHATQDTTMDTLISDIKQQQLKAMLKDTEGRATSDSYGVYFEQNRYTLFHGATFTSQPENFVVDLTTAEQFSAINLPSSQIVFAPGSGEVSNFSAGQQTFILRNTQTNQQKTVTINQVGSITQIQ